MEVALWEGREDEGEEFGGDGGERGGGDHAAVAGEDG